MFKKAQLVTLRVTELDTWVTRVCHHACHPRVMGDTGTDGLARERRAAMADERPAWARRMTNERKTRGWSQADAVRAMRAHAPGQLPSDSSLLRQWKRWETGEVEPDRGKAEPFYKPVIAATFGTATHAIFPVAPQRDAGADVLAMTGMDTLESSEGCSTQIWTKPRLTVSGSWRTGCARNTRSCLPTSCSPKAGPGFAG